VHFLATATNSVSSTAITTGGVGQVEAAAEEAVGGALGMRIFRWRLTSTVVAGAVVELRGGGLNDPQD
jgi:hypothetical protein